ncbi:bifunctional UDP-N-acetylglucosamine pyrophosphorylase / Glucosamine-1-phosphate N-acetyltransferase [Anaerolineae bacterium]|nr:bifunctional UDP-N-acetylglucosamine pyrophosphorylase / Glucosamine-1-phosphate N-acetyltransferase [Anaerolineae bacterium]
MSESSGVLACVILAAGMGTRMKSEIAKVLHPVGGKPMVARSVETAERIGAGRLVLVVGHNSESVEAAVGSRAECVLQQPLLGTGHAVMQAAPLLRGAADYVVVYYADMPLLRAETVARLVSEAQTHEATITMLTVTVPDPRGFGRVVRASDGSVAAIVEDHEATPEQRAIRELNAGVYVFHGDWLWDALSRIKPKRKGEYYLTDLIEIATASGLKVHGVETDDPDELIGVNNRVHLAEAEAALRRRINYQWMLEGVTILDPNTTYISEDAALGRDVTILPNTHIQGKTTIGAGSQIGPNTLIRDSRIGANCKIVSSVVEEAITEDAVHMGPFAHLRSKAYLESGVHMGNFGEVKNSRLGRGTRMGHFSYIGDAEIGADVNIGAGVITVNYDGARKHKTRIGDHAFIGSDTMLIAPVEVNDEARTAAGSVVTRNVPSGHIAVGVPARLRPLRPADEEMKAKSE